MATYTLPNMPRHEIITYLSDFQIFTLTESDLLKPNLNIAFDLYSSILHYLDALEEDVDFEATQRLDNPEMHNDAARAMNLCTLIKEFFQNIECPVKFMLNDLIRPDSGRMIKFLIAVINFILYRSEKLDVFTSYGDRIELLEEERKQKESINLQWQEEIKAIKAAREEEKPLIQEAEAKVNELRQAIDNLNTLQSNLRKERQSMKEKAQELSNNVSAAEFELIQATEENAIWRSKIVQSPAKLQTALEEKKAIVTEAKDADKLAMQRFQEKTAIVEVYAKAGQKMTKQLAQMQAIQEQVNSAKSVEKDVKQLKAKLSDEQMLDISLEAKVTECDAKAEQLDKQKSQLENEEDLRRDEDRRVVNNVKLETESSRQKLESRGRKVKAVITEVEAIKAKINSVKELAAATQLELLRKSEEIVNEVNVYSSLMVQNCLFKVNGAKLQIMPNIQVAEN